jgi:hypothetical protein
VFETSQIGTFISSEFLEGVAGGEGEVELEETRALPAVELDEIGCGDGGERGEWGVRAEDTLDLGTLLQDGHVGNGSVACVGGVVLKSMTSRLESVCTPSSEERVFLLVARFLSLARGARGVSEAMLFWPMSSFSRFLQFLMGYSVLIWFQKQENSFKFVQSACERAYFPVLPARSPCSR